MQLYEDAVALGHGQQTALTMAVERPLDQLESQSRRLLKRTTATLGSLEQSHHLLAQRGIDAHRLRSLLDTIQTMRAFTPVRHVADTDVDAYLRNQHELLLISALDSAAQKVFSRLSVLFFNVVFFLDFGGE